MFQREAWKEVLITCPDDVWALSKSAHKALASRRAVEAGGRSTMFDNLIELQFRLGAADARQQKLSNDLDSKAIGYLGTTLVACTITAFLSNSDFFAMSWN